MKSSMPRLRSALSPEKLVSIRTHDAARKRRLRALINSDPETRAGYLEDRRRKQRAAYAAKRALNPKPKRAKKSQEAIKAAARAYKNAKRAKDPEAARAKDRLRNKEKRRERERQWRRNNPEKARAKDLLASEKSRERRRLYAVQWRIDNRERSVALAVNYERRRIKYDPEFKLRRMLRARIRSVLRRFIKAGEPKPGSPVKDLGCSIGQLKVFIENMWLPGMDWSNWTPRGWHLDHVRPLSRFNLLDRKQYLEACHYTNYQPLWAKDNMAKGARETLPHAEKTDQGL